MPFVITPREIKIVMLGLLIGILHWFVFAGARDWFLEKYPDANTVLIGAIGILIILFIFKYIGRMPIKI